MGNWYKAVTSIMERLKSIDDYYILIKEVRRQCKISFSNMYCMTNEIQRYIDLGRLYFIKLESGVAFMIDEEKYYKLCLYVDSTASFFIPELDKKILMRNIYREGLKNNSVQQVENGLIQNGFQKDGTSVQIQGSPSEITDRKKSVERCIGIIERNGYKIVQADAAMLDGIENLLEEVPFLHDYHTDFKTTEEKQQNLKQGGYLCVIDEHGKVCAATVTWVHGKSADGGAIAVREQYRTLGLAPAICYERLKQLKGQGVGNLQGWVLLDNEASIRYHKSMGFEFMDRYADEWIREGKNR